MLRLAAAIFFLLSGTFMSMMFAMGWGLWYLSCAVLWTASGFIWMWQLSWGSRFAAFPVLAIATLMALLFLPPYREHAHWDPVFWFYGSQILCIAIALSLIIATIRKTSAPTFTPWIISFTLVFGCFLLNTLFVDRLAIKSYRVQVSFDADGPNAVALTRSGRNGVVCFDAFHSKELHDFLLSKNGQSVTVNYDTRRGMIAGDSTN